MNKGLFLCGLFIALFLAGCEDDEVKIANQMTLYSRPDTIHLGGDLGMDSILVKGFTACEAYDAKWGTLPEVVAREFDMNASYLYFSYEARVVLLEDSIYDIGIGHFLDEKAGFSEDLSSHGFVIRTFGVQKDKKQVLACTYLIYVEKNSDGEKIDRWLPVRPEELQWRYLRIEDFDQLKNIE